ncbi:type II toxin-antitoxin system PemK/MazF family toxin, partial [Acinetobacter baumannii]
MPQNYVPEEGDIIWINFNPQSGHEQAGHRPALVLSPSSYNKATSLLV